MKQRLSKELQQDMQCHLATSGEIKLVPYAWDSTKEHFNKPARYRATVNVQENGRTHVIPIQTGSNGNRYNKIFTTANGEVRTTQTKVIMVLAFPLKYGKALVGALMQDEMREMEAFIRTRKDTTNWAEA